MLRVARSNPASRREQLEEDDVSWDVEHEVQTLASELQREQEERDGTALPGHASPKRKSKPTARAIS